jgi:hypothetical protein
MDQILRRILDALDLFKNNPPFLLDLLRKKCGVPYKVRKNIEGNIQMLFEAPSVVTSQIATGESVQASPKGLKTVRDPKSITAFGTLEHPVFHKMGDPLLFG